MHDSAERIPDDLVMAFAPLHKRAFGSAFGIAGGALLLVATVYAVLRPGHTELLPLLSNHLLGYSVSWTGALAGFAWGWLMGFTLGWFTAFCRNFFIAASLWLVRTRAEMDATRDFLDHI